MSEYCVDHIGEGQARHLDEHYIALRRGGRLYVYQNLCPHQHVALSEPLLDAQGAHIYCHRHGALFEVDTGECIFGPCQGQSLTGVAFRWLDEDRIAITSCM